MLSHHLIFGALFGAGLAGSYVWVIRRQNQTLLAANSRSPFVEDALRLPGHSERLRRSDYFDAITVKYDQFLLWSILLIATVFLPSALLVILAALPCIAGCAYILVQSIRINQALQASILKCDGEEYTGQELNYLWSRGACVYHDIPCGEDNIDHVVVGHDKVLVVETLTVRKRGRPRSVSGDSSQKVIYDGAQLTFPDKTTIDALSVARNRAKHVAQSILSECGFEFPVKPVVAVPGWHVEITPSCSSELLVINPKRGHGLNLWIGKKMRSGQRVKVNKHLSRMARRSRASSRRTDTGTTPENEFWLSPRYRERITRD